MRAALLLALLMPAVSLATPHAARTWPIDPANSYVQFRIRKFWIAHTSGTFPALAGTLHELAGAGPVPLARVDATLEVDGLEMDDADDRAVALGPDFFDARRFPVIRFDSDPFPMHALAAGGDLRGMLTMHGARQPVTLSLEPSACPRQPLACAIRARGAIPRSAFGMSRLPGILSNTVKLDLSILLDARAAAAERARQPE